LTGNDYDQLLLTAIDIKRSVSFNIGGYNFPVEYRVNIIATRHMDGHVASE